MHRLWFAATAILVFGWAAAMLGGCAAIEPSGTVVRIANWGGAGDDSDFNRLVKRLYAEFEEENPGIRIQVEGIPGSQEYVSKLLLAYIARSEPDVITLDASSAAVFIDNGVLRDLRPYIDRDPDVRPEDYFPNVFDIARRGEAVYAIPGDFNPMALYYNKDHFDAAGIPYPQNNWTWDDFLAAAKATTRDGRFGFVFANWMPGWIMWLWNNGGDVLSPDGSTAVGYFDSPQSVEAVQFLADLVSRHRVSPSLSQAAAMGVDLFATGRAAMQISGQWSIVGLQAAPAIKMDRIGVVTLPTRLSKPVTVMYQAGYAIGRHSRNPDAAWEFIKFWTSSRVQMRYQTSGVAISARKDVAEALADTQIKKDFLKMVPLARLPWGARVEGYDLVEQIGQKAMDRILNGGVPVQRALSDAAREIDREFARR